MAFHRSFLGPAEERETFVEEPRDGACRWTVARFGDGFAEAVTRRLTVVLGFACPTRAVGRATGGVGRATRGVGRARVGAIAGRETR